MAVAARRRAMMVLDAFNSQRASVAPLSITEVSPH